jgi:hypothetical protein
MEGEDVIAWHYDQRGLFSVKSSYHVLEDNHEQQHQMQQGSLTLCVPRVTLMTLSIGCTSGISSVAQRSSSFYGDWCTTICLGD